MVSGNKEPTIEKTTKLKRRNGQEWIDEVFIPKHGNLYSYDKVSKDIWIKKNDKITITCRKHGDFSQSPGNHGSGNGCPECSKERNRDSKDEFIEKAISVHADKYDYSLVKDSDIEFVDILCRKHGVFPQRRYAHLNGQGCPICSNEAKSSTYMMSSKDFIEKATLKHCNRYDYSLVEYKGMNKEIHIVCRKHGSFHQLASDHVSGKGCRKCGYEAMSEEYTLGIDEVLEKCKNVHGDIYDYSKSKNSYVNSKTEFEVICRIHGSFYPTPNNHIYKESKCPICSGVGISEIENKLSVHLTSLGLEVESRVKIYDNERDKRSYTEFDIVIENVAIEVNGIYWHSDKFKDKNYHLDKIKVARENGLHCIQFTDMELERNFDLCVSMILSKLGRSKKIHARKCHIKSIDSSVASEFLDENHMQGSKYKGSLNYGLYHDDILVSVMTFGKPRFNKQYDWELIRFASLRCHTIVGGASKIISYFRKSNVGSLLTYANRRWSEGNLYEKIGFNYIGVSSPGYEWWSSKEINSYSRYQTQKHNLQRILGDKFDSSLTEELNMSNNGFFKVYDCGNLIYEMK